MRTRLIIAAVWTCYPCVLAAEAEPEPKSCTTAKQHLALAEAALGHDELVAADREYRSVIGDGSLCLAALEVSRNDLASAVHVLNDNVENAADPVEILVQTSVVYLQKEDPQLALRAAQDASARDPSNLRAKRVLALAAEEANRAGQPHVGTEHLLIGLSREDESLAHFLLAEMAVTTDQLRSGLARLPPTASFLALHRK